MTAQLLVSTSEGLLPKNEQYPDSNIYRTSKSNLPVTSNKTIKTREMERVYFDKGTPEEYVTFENAAKVILWDVEGEAAKEKKLKEMLGMHALVVAYSGRSNNYGTPEGVFTALAVVFRRKMTSRAEDYHFITLTDHETQMILKAILSSGAIYNTVGEIWARKHNWSEKALETDVSLKICGGSTLHITKQTSRRLECVARNGRVEGEERFLIIPGSGEQPTLGKEWTHTHKVLILPDNRILFDNGTAHEYLKGQPKFSLEVGLKTSPRANYQIKGHKLASIGEKS